MTQKSMTLLSASVGVDWNGLDWIGLNCDRLNASIYRITREDRMGRIFISENNMKV